MWGCRQPVLLRRIEPVGWKAECSFHQTQTLQTPLLLLLSHSEILAQCLCHILRPDLFVVPTFPAPRKHSANKAAQLGHLPFQ